MCHSTLINDELKESTQWLLAWQHGGATALASTSIYGIDNLPLLIIQNIPIAANKSIYVKS